MFDCILSSTAQDSDVERNSDRERDYGENLDSAASNYGSGEKKKKKKHKERSEKKTKKKKKDNGDRDSSQEETTKVKLVSFESSPNNPGKVQPGFFSTACRAEDFCPAGQGVGTGGC